MAEGTNTTAARTDTAPAGNDTKYVSTTRGVKGGYFFFAPAGSAVPTDIETPLDAAYKCGGFIGEDGFTESLDGDSDSMTDMNGDTVDTSSGAKTETCAATLISMDENALSIQYGSANVDSSNSKYIKVSHDWSKAEEELSIVFELVLKNGRRWRKVVPACKVTELGEFTGNSTTLAGREVTFTYLVGADGAGCVDYLEKVA